MKVDMNGMIYALSYSLDCVEAELVGVKPDHAKWVAFLSTLVGRTYGLDENELADLSACAALHDNALTQYVAERYNENGDTSGSHCTMGQENIEDFPFYNDVTGFITYHHENCDGSGPFSLKADETPLQAQIIHIADMLDVGCNVKDVSTENYQRMMNYLNQNSGKMFAPELVEHMKKAISSERYFKMKDKTIDELLGEELSHKAREFTFEQIKAVTDVFGKIVDYKSPFTRNHSFRIADKIMIMSKEYGYDESTAQRLYVAGVLHDIGKMAISNDVLEKPDRLSNEEFAYMQNHAWYTYVILKQIDGFDDITKWAAMHHEKLNGKGYPFGKSGDELDQKQRLMACIDIYQALSEDRPYKAGMKHEKCIEIMRDMAGGGFIDADITEDINRVFAVC